MRTDFFTRSLDTSRHQAYDKLVHKVMSVITGQADGDVLLVSSDYVSFSAISF